MSLVEVKRGDRWNFTRAKSRVIASTKWDENITRKYRIASSAMVPKSVGTLSPADLDVLAK